jgi:predicted nucleotidyltransferase
MIIPILGMAPKRTLADALFTRTQQRVLGLLFGQPHRSFYTAEIIRLTKAGSGATQRELAKLDEAGLVEVLQIGNQLNYSANRQSPIFEELVGIVVKTVGLAEPLRQALHSLAPQIRAAFVFGSVAKGTARSSSDIDLMILADDLTYAEIFAAIEAAHGTLGRTVNPTVYTTREFAKRRADGSAFILRVLDSPKIWIIGAEDDLAV